MTTNSTTSMGALSENERKEVQTDEFGSKKFEWQSELCDHVGFYEPDGFSEKQLKDTYFLLFVYNSVTALNTDVTLDNPEYYTAQYIQDSLKKLEQEYLEATQKLKTLDVVPTQFWRKHKELSLLQLKEVYKLEKLTLEAHLNPALLKNTPLSDECVNYVDALITEDTTVLLAEWKKLVEVKKSKSGTPEKLEQEYQIQSNSTDRLLFAKIDLMTYGWWNCANRQRKYLDGFNKEGQMTMEFQNLFNKIESNCEE